MGVHAAKKQLRSRLRALDYEAHRPRYTPHVGVGMAVACACGWDALGASKEDARRLHKAHVREHSHSRRQRGAA